MQMLASTEISQIWLHTGIHPVTDASTTEHGLGAIDASTTGLGATDACATGLGATDASVTGLGATDASTTGLGTTDACATGLSATDARTTGLGATDTRTTGLGTTDACTTGLGATDASTTGLGAEYHRTRCYWCKYHRTRCYSWPRWSCEGIDQSNADKIRAAIQCHPMPVSSFSITCLVANLPCTWNKQHSNGCLFKMEGFATWKDYSTTGPWQSKTTTWY